MNVSGIFDCWCYSPSGLLLWEEHIQNAVTDTALNSILDNRFNSGAQTANWYLGLLNASGFTGVASGDTMSSHAGWTEFTSYTSATRPAWGQAAASGKIVQNATLVTFTFNGSGTLEGLFLANNSTKSGTTGELHATGLFPAERAVISGYQLPVRYRVIAAAG